MYGRAVALAVALVAAAGCSSADPAAPSAPAVTPIESAEVSITKPAFVPGAILVSRGARVTFINEDETDHTVTFADSTVTSVARFPAGSREVVMPETPGTYEYHCALHPNERGSIQVE